MNIASEFDGCIAVRAYGRALRMPQRDPSLAVSRNWRQATSLHLAAQLGAMELVDALVEARCPLDALDDHGWSALRSVAYYQRHGAVHHLASLGAEYDIISASTLGDPIRVADLLNQSPELARTVTKRGDGPLHNAAQRGAVDVVHILVAHGADVNLSDIIDRTPLQAAVGRLHSAAAPVAEVLIGYGATVDILSAAGLGWLDVVQKFLDADPSAIGPHGFPRETPLHLAASSRSLETAALLLGRGADLEAQDRAGKTPLHNAAFAGDPAMVKMLLDRGADPNKSDVIHQTPVQCAGGAGFRNVREVLLSNGANPNALGAGEETLLDRASRHGEPSEIRYLMSLGIDPGARNREGCSALHLAAQYNNVAAIRELCSAGVDMDAQDNQGRAALHWAANYNWWEAVEALVAAGADIHRRDNDGKTPLDLAEMYGEWEESAPVR